MTGKLFLLTALIFWLLHSPDAQAGVRRRGAAAPRTPRTPTAAAAPAAPAEGGAVKKSVADMCEPNYRLDPFKPLAPFPPVSTGSLAIPSGDWNAWAAVTDAEESQLRFESCRVFSSGGGPAGERQLCDLTFGRVIRTYAKARKSIKDDLDFVCQKITSGLEDCNLNQAGSQTCVKGVYDGAATKLRVTINGLKQAKDLLANYHRTHVVKATREKARILAAPPSTITAADYSRDIAKFEKEGKTGIYANRSRQIFDCRDTKVKDPVFCGHISAATEAKLFSDQYNIQLTKTEKTANLLAQAGKAAGDNEGKSGPGNESTVTGKSGSGMGLDDITKLATLGATGATLYCTMTGKCSKKNEPAASDPTGGATSPTPASSAAPSIEKSSTGESTSKTGGGPIVGAVDTTPKDDGASHAGFHEGGGLGSGFSSEKNDTSPHLSANGHAPASSGPVGGAGGGGGGGSGGGLGSDSTAASAPHDTGKGFEAPSGGGGPPSASFGASSTGFNLGDSHSGTPTDAALKDILNGDATPGIDGALAGLDGLDGSGNPKAGGGDGIDDPENLFFRVRSTHVRCLKRGCVGQGVGDNI